MAIEKVKRSALLLPAPDGQAALDRLGLRGGDRGTHTSRTIMFAELALLLQAVPMDAPQATYRSAVVDENVLGKRSQATRELSFQRLKELYGLDPRLPMFRFLRFLWSVDREGRPLLAFLAAYARDPLLRLTAPAVFDAEQGARVGTTDVQLVLEKVTGNRFNPSILNKVARNAASSWTQSGHLRGRVQKCRSRPGATPGATALALFLGYLQGLRAQRLFASEWIRILDVPRDHVHQLAREAAQRGWLKFLHADTVVEIRFPGRLTPKEEEWTHEPH